MPETAATTTDAIETAKAQRRARGGTVDRSLVQRCTNLAWNAHERLAAIERQSAADRLVASVGQVEDIQDIASNLFAEVTELWHSLALAAGLPAEALTVPPAASELRGDLSSVSAGDTTGAATGPGRAPASTPAGLSEARGDGRDAA